MRAEFKRRVFLFLALNILGLSLLPATLPVWTWLIDDIGFRYGYLSLILGLHLVILVAASFRSGISSLVTRLEDRQLTGALVLYWVYGLVVNFVIGRPLWMGQLDLSIICVSIFTLMFCLPRLLNEVDYRTIFLVLLLALSAHFYLTNAAYYLGYKTLFHHRLATDKDYRVSFTRVLGFFFNRNFLGPFLQFLPSISLQMVVRKKVSKELGFFFFWTTFLATFLTFSRSALLACVISLLPFALYFFNQERRRRGLPTGTLYLIVGLLMILAQPCFRIYVTFYEGLTDRDSLWRNVLRWIRQRPWFGHGYTPLRSGVFYGMLEKHEHNIFLHQLVVSGMVGLFFFLLLLYFLWRALPSARNLKSPAARVSVAAWHAMFWGALAQGFFDILTFQCWEFVHQLLFLGIGFGLQSADGNTVSGLRRK